MPYLKFVGTWVIFFGTIAREAISSRVCQETIFEIDIRHEKTSQIFFEPHARSVQPVHSTGMTLASKSTPDANIMSAVIS